MMQRWSRSGRKVVLGVVLTAALIGGGATTAYADDRQLEVGSDCEVGTGFTDKTCWTNDDPSAAKQVEVKAVDGYNAKFHIERADGTTSGVKELNPGETDSFTLNSGDKVRLRNTQWFGSIHKLQIISVTDVPTIRT